MLIYFKSFGPEGKNKSHLPVFSGLIGRFQ